MTTLALLSTGQDQASRYRQNGWWRDETFLDDLSMWARIRPDAPAFVTGRSDGDGRSIRVLTYREYDENVQRFAGGLYDLGVRPGDVVAFQLPDWWETAALLLACMKVGAIAQPMVPELRARELERALTRTSARICIVVDRWNGFDHAAALAEVAPKLPHLRHRVVYGDSARTGALDFHDCLAGDRVNPAPMPVLDPDRPCLVLFTSGSTGEAKGVLHTFNTIYAGAKGFTATTTELAPGIDRAAAAVRVSHIAGPLWMVFGTLLSGGAGVFLDAFDADQLLDLMEQAQATRFLTTPPRLFQLIEAQNRRRRDLSSLHTVGVGGATVPTQLVPAVREAFGVPLRAVWGMTEVVVGSIVGIDDPEDWSSHSDGRALPGVEFRIVTPDGKDGAGALHVRGASLCPGTIREHIGQISATATSDDGWFDTGDIARSDGRGGIRIMGRVADRIYDRTATVIIPVRDVEDELLRHPNVGDVAIIACQDGVEEQVCAVVVPSGPPPSLADLCEFLTRCGMTEWYHPNRLEIVEALPRDPLGKIRKYQLRDQFSAPQPA